MQLPQKEQLKANNKFALEKDFTRLGCHGYSKAGVTNFFELRATSCVPIDAKGY